MAILHRTYRIYCYFLVRTIVVLFPARFWYRVLYSICFLQGKLLRVVLALTPLRKDYRYRIIVTWLMQSTLPHMIALDRPFPIPTRDKNVEALLEARKDSKGVALCSVHIPFIRLVLRRLVELDVRPTAVVAHETALVYGRMPVWGMTETLPGLVADRNVLFKVRNVLRQGGLVATLVDINLGDPLNCNVFRLIRSAGARLVFVSTELQADGAILVEFFAPPDPLCLSNESVLSNLLVLQRRTDSILQLPSRRSAPTTLPLKKGNSRAQIVDLGA
jgi:hypothetical protein